MNRRSLILSVTGDPGYGAERLLASFIAALPRELAQQCILARPPGSSLSRWAPPGAVEVVDFSARDDTFTRNLVAAMALARALRRHNVGLVHAWGARAFEAALLLGRRLHVPVSGTLHDHPEASIHGRARRALIRYAASRLQPIVGVSDAVAAACSEAGLGGDIIVIKNGASFAPLRPHAPDREPVRVAFLGLYAAWKGFDIVHDWIRQCGAEIEWHLYGNPALESEAACAALRAEGRKNVIFHGWVDGDDILTEMDILVHASTSFEPFGMVLVEAARAAIPVVASDLGGPREIVVDGETGFLFSPAAPAGGLEHLRKLVSSPELRRQMGNAARRRFETDFAIGRMVDAYVRLWRARASADLG